MKQIVNGVERKIKDGSLVFFLRGEFKWRTLNLNSPLVITLPGETPADLFLLFRL